LKSIFARLSPLLIAAILAACSGTPNEKPENWSPQRIYQEAKDEMNSGSFERAIPLFERLEGRAAGTILSQQAQLEKAYAQYRGRDQEQSIATIDRFIKQHPTSPAMDYALYLKGLVNFNEDLGLLGFLGQQDLAERDQKASKAAFDAFSELVNRFPESKYSPDARLRITYIINSLARYEVYVARYYLNRGAYVAAINRAQAAVAEYPNVAATEEALYILVRSYDALGMPQLRDDTQRVLLKNYPNTALLKGGFQDRTRAWWQLW
jgi:outer membrane protein assembly factor BamD